MCLNVTVTCIALTSGDRDIYRNPLGARQSVSSFSRGIEQEESLYQKTPGKSKKVFACPGLLPPL
jgi:hypothetical protein